MQVETNMRLIVCYIYQIFSRGDNMDVAINVSASPPKQRKLSKWKYSVLPENFHQLELGEYRTYGIQIITSDHVDILHDVSACKELTAHIVALLNHYQVSPVHLYDVVVDMLP